MSREPAPPRRSVVVGGAGAIGSAVARALVQRGDDVTIVGRGPSIERARAELGAPRVDAIECDLASMTSVRSAAAVIARRGSVGAVFHCAGVFSATPRTSLDGHELMVATNHLAPALLTLALRDALRAGRAHVVFVAPVPRKPVGLAHWIHLRARDPAVAFAASRAMGVAFACELARRWCGAVSVSAANPGPTRSALLREAPIEVRLALAAVARSPEAAIAPILQASTRPAGLLVGHRKVVSLESVSPDAAARRRVWEWSVALLGLSSSSIELRVA